MRRAPRTSGSSQISAATFSITPRVAPRSTTFGLPRVWRGVGRPYARRGRGRCRMSAVPRATIVHPTAVRARLLYPLLLAGVFQGRGTMFSGRAIGALSGCGSGGSVLVPDRPACGRDHLRPPQRTRGAPDGHIRANDGLASQHSTARVLAIAAREQGTSPSGDLHRRGWRTGRGDHRNDRSDTGADVCRGRDESAFRIL
jgi:hypothetical protein